MTTPVNGTKRSEPLAARGSAAAGNTPGAFDASLRIEQADTLLSQTDQYALWQRIRQSNEKQAQRLAELVIQRDTLLNNRSKGLSINWQALNQLTNQLRQAGINLPRPPAAAPAPGKTPRNTGAQEPQPRPTSSMLREENQLILTLKCAAAGIDQTVSAYGDGQPIHLP